LAILSLTAAFGLACAQSATAATQFVMTSPHVAGASTGHGKYHPSFVQALALGALILLVLGAVVYGFWLLGRALTAAQQNKIDAASGNGDR